MHKADMSVNRCVICLEALGEEPSEQLRFSFLPVFIQRFLKKESTLTLKPCAHQFHLKCANQWLNETPRCPLDRRLVTGSSPSGLLSINLHSELLRSVEGNRIKDVQDILSAGLPLEQLSCRDGINLLTLALENCYWEVAAQLLGAGWTTTDKAALNNLGWMYCNGLGVAQDYAKALFWYDKAANKGSIEAQNWLGWLHEYGLGVQQNCAKAVFWYRKAADDGHAQAQSNLGCLYRSGLGVRQNYAEALIYLNMAANQKDAKAQNTLGWMYHNGEGVEQDYVIAQFFYHRAARQGYAPAQINLGYLYANGLGVEQNHTEALFWIHSAAEQGDPVAQNLLGWMYQGGVMVEQDSTMAFFWYHKAAEQGHANAQNSLG